MSVILLEKMNESQYIKTSHNKNCQTSIFSNIPFYLLVRICAC